jgi:hypothetical protein
VLRPNLQLEAYLTPHQHHHRKMHKEVFSEIQGNLKGKLKAFSEVNNNLLKDRYLDSKVLQIKGLTH